MRKKSNEAVGWRCSVKKLFLKIFQNSQENTRVRVSFLIKLHAETCNCNKEKIRLWHRCIFVNFATFLKRLFSREDLRWLLVTNANSSRYLKDLWRKLLLLILKISTIESFYLLQMVTKH